MHSFVFGSGFCHLFSRSKIWLPPAYDLKHAAACRNIANFSWGPLVHARMSTREADNDVSKLATDRRAPPLGLEKLAPPLVGAIVPRLDG